MNCQERDFCRRRLARRKRLKDDISAQRPEIGDHDVREMAAKTAFLLASCQLRVSEDWVVETVDIELAAHHAVVENRSPTESGTGIFRVETARQRNGRADAIH
jgi:hypothetical protein